MTDNTEPKERPVLSYAQIQAKRRAAENPKNMALPPSYVTTGPYLGPNMTPARAGANDSQQFKSLGLRAQVTVRKA